MDDICNKLIRGFGLTKDDVFPVGSTGKRLENGSSGDIDLAIDQNKLMAANGFETPDEYIDKCQELAEKFDVDIVTKPKKGWTGTSYAWPIANADGKQENEYVQLDLVVTDNTRFTKWCYHTDQEKELQDGELDKDVNPKTKVKTTLIQAIAKGGHEKVLKYGEVDGQEEPVEVEGYDYDYRKGLVKYHKHREAKKRGGYSKAWKNDGVEFVTGDPDEIVNMVFSSGVSSDSILTPRDAWEAFKDSPLWRDEETRSKIQNEWEKLVRIRNIEEPTYFRFDESLVTEGGHAESDCPEELKARINQENVQATLEDIYKRLLPRLGLTKDDVECVGSTGKKLPGGTSGDIDLAMPQDKIMQTTECETPEEFIDFCQELFKELDVYDATAKGYGWKSVSCFWPIANEDGKQENKYVQLDFVVTNNMKFVSWGMHGT